MTPAQVAHIMALAKECGAITYTHRSNPHEAAVSFGPIAWAKFVEAALLAPQAEPVAWRWKERDRFFNWTTDWEHHDKAKAMGCEIEYATPSAPTGKDSLAVEPDERAMFEAWAEPITALAKENGQYVEVMTSLAWEAWQARASKGTK